VRIAVVPGDGIGVEVVTESLRVLDEVIARFGLDLAFDVFDWGAQRFVDDGVGLPDGALERLRRDYQAVFLGALGDPRIPDMAHGRQILLGLRRGLDLYVNHRPLDLPHGTVDVYRENTQGLYLGIGGAVSRDGAVAVAIDECVYLRDTVQRFVRFSLGDLVRRGRRRVTLVHKANAVPNTGRLWQDVFWYELQQFPELAGSEEYVDAFCYHLVRDASAYQGVLTDNLFGDIISDIGAALAGGLGLAPSASICPETGMGLFEPVHGSAPDIAGTGAANPYAAMMSLVLLLEHLGLAEPAQAVRAGLVAATRSVAATPDLGGIGTTRTFTDEVLRRVRETETGMSVTAV
jgi:isocitrate/isopropylmalate dehydrogenase